MAALLSAVAYIGDTLCSNEALQGHKIFIIIADHICHYY